MDCPGVDSQVLQTEVAGARVVHHFNVRERVEGSGHFPVPPTGFAGFSVWFVFLFFLEGGRFTSQAHFPGEPLRLHSLREAQTRGTRSAVGDSLADRTAPCPGQWWPVCLGRRASGCPGRRRAGCPVRRRRLEGVGMAPLPRSPRGAPGALSPRGRPALTPPPLSSPGVPWSRERGSRKVPQEPPRKRRPGRRGRRGAEGQGRGSRAAEPSPAAGTAAGALGPASAHFQRKLVSVFGECFAGMSHQGGSGGLPPPCEKGLLSHLSWGPAKAD